MKYTIKHPRKIIWAMRDFINEIHNVTYEGVSVKSIPGESFEDWWKRFSETEVTEFKATCRMVRIEENNFCAFLSDKGDPIFRIGYNLNSLSNKKAVRKTFTSRSSVCHGFANITLALLHELGHFSSQQEFEDYDREEEMAFLRSIPAEFARPMYFLLPDEMSATDWAVEWLQDAEHRKIAKAFEKKFFACLEKRG